MTEVVFRIVLAPEEKLPEDYVEDIGTYLHECLEDFFDEFGSPVEMTAKLSVDGRVEQSFTRH